MFWTILVIIALVILLFMMRRRAAYKKLFADAHFLEIAEGVQHLKAAALARIETVEKQKLAPPDNPHNDPRILLTSQNLRVFYTVQQSEESFEHQFSLSIANGYTAIPVGETFSLYLALLLAFASQHFTIERSPHGIYHVEWQLTPGKQETFARTPVTIPQRAELPAIYERLEKWRGEISVQQTELPLPD